MNDIPFVLSLLKKLEKELEFTIHFQEANDYLGYIEFNNAVRHICTQRDLHINKHNAFLLAQNKYYTNKLLSHFGFPIPEYQIFSRDTFNMEEVNYFVKSIGYPLFVKPNMGQKGSDVACVENDKELKETINDVFRRHSRIIIQQKAQGVDYRIIIYKGKCIAAYRRTPPTLEGDGRSSIQKLLDNWKNERKKDHREVIIDTKRMAKVLEKQNFTLQSVPRPKQKISIVDTANLSTGGFAEDVTNILHPDYKKLAKKATKFAGLDICGVDLVIKGDCSVQMQKNCGLLELNASPGFEHYAKTSNENFKRIENLFRELAKDIRDNSL